MNHPEHITKLKTKEHPIIFSTGMVQAILEGRKTQTRRVLKLHKAIDKPEFGYTTFTPERNISVRGFHGGIYGESFIKCPYGKVGDTLYVRETWQLTDSSINFKPGYVYKATDPDWDTMENWKWKPSIFMPRIASRIFLEITNIKVERLQDISEADAKAEGVIPFKKNYDNRDDCWTDDKYKTAYEFLWNDINGWMPNAWNVNPFVWVIEFKKVTE